MERYNIHTKRDKEHRAKMDKLSKFVDMLCKNKRPHEIKNELTYFISVVK